MTKCQDKHNVGPLDISIERDVPRLAARDQQIAQSLLSGPTDERMPLQYRDRFADRFNNRCGARDIVGSDEVKYPLEIAKRLRRIDDQRQILAFGRVAFRPATLARR